MGNISSIYFDLVSHLPSKVRFAQVPDLPRHQVITYVGTYIVGMHSPRQHALNALLLDQMLRAPRQKLGPFSSLQSSKCIVLSGTIKSRAVASKVSDIAQKHQTFSTGNAFGYKFGLRRAANTRTSAGGLPR